MRVFFKSFCQYWHSSYNYILHRYTIPLFTFFQDPDSVLSKLNKKLKEDNRIGREMILLTAFEQFHCLLNYVTMEFNEIFVIKNLDWFSVYIIDTFRATSSIILKRPIIIYMFIKKKEFLLLFRVVIVYLLNLRRTW